MGKPEELLALKQKYWEKSDYESVKKVRLAIKEYDRAHALKEKITPYELFEGLGE